MAGFSTAAANAILALLFNATAWADIAENDSSSPNTNIAHALHTADPGDGGTQSTSETTYTSYARVDVARTTGGFSAPSGGSTSPVANIDFPTGSGGSGTITHFSAGKTGGGATAIHMAGPVTPNISAGSGVLPRLTTATTYTLT